MDERSLRSIIKAANIADKALADALKFLNAGIKEKSFASRLFRSIKLHGGDGFSFRPIIASGKRSAIPHGRASEKYIRDGDIVVVDFGVKYKGFCSDTTRTFVVGKPSKKQVALFNILKEAQKKALAAVKDGVECRKVDAKARGYLKRFNLDKYFIHSTGHGIAKRVHEPPRISRKSDDKLSSGTVITIEPGIYMKGWGGMRIEDMTLVTKTGHRLLTSFPRKLVPK